MPKDSAMKMMVDKGDSTSSAVTATVTDEPFMTRLWDVIHTFYPLGFVAFGGPQAHIAILRDHLVLKHNWMGEEEFTELFAIGQGLPGPTSTQLVVSCATSRAGPIGGCTALFMWNLPGMIVCIIAGCGISVISPGAWYMAGLGPAAIGLLFKAAYGFTGKVSDKLGATLALISCIVSVLIAGDVNIDKGVCQWVYPLLLVLGSLFTLVDSKRENPFGVYKGASKGWDADNDLTFKRIGIPLWVGACIFIFWAVLLGVCLVYRAQNGFENGGYVPLFECMYRVGSIIFGGGQVVLPMLKSEVVDPGWITLDTFLAGFALAQSLPGPLFNFSAFVGAAYLGVGGALVAYLGLFGPGVILIFAMMPFWATLRQTAWFKAVLVGLNATAIGFVFAACIIMYDLTIGNVAQASSFVVAGAMAVVYKAPAPACILTGGVVGAILTAVNLGLKPFPL